jgi:hypothetical protein
VKMLDRSIANSGMFTSTCPQAMYGSIEHSAGNIARLNSASSERQSKSASDRIACAASNTKISEKG